MPKFTDEQIKAIETSGSNIIVSAGAGSGKTAVLTERVIHNLQKGMKINEMLILTFTNAAAYEMKDRIRKKIYEHEELKDNLDYLENAYITTFDSFTLSLVKKYHYILNVSPNLNIVESNIINKVKKDILDNIFLEYYNLNNIKFNKLINDFAVKNDTQIKDAILKTRESLTLKSDLDLYLDNYLDMMFNPNKLSELEKEYTNLILSKIEEITTNLMYLENYNNDYYLKIETSLINLINSKTYDEILNNINVSLPRVPKEEVDIKIYKDNISNLIKDIKSYLRFNNTKEIQDTILMTKDYIEIIIDIIKEFNKRLNSYKYENNLYEFNDIAILAIKLLKDNYHIKEEIKNTYKEICVDEYQDTSILQEEFINLIGNNNILMVGDIKQSIYRFRNAEASIFKEKYDLYSHNNGGIKIDLLKNFRSRKEVLAGINEIFSYIMDNTLGSANYRESHMMNFGNIVYEEEKDNKQNYNLEILNYNDEDSIYTKDEIETFIIARDIQNKINNHYQVLDSNTHKLRCCRYDDFCIIMDRSSSFTKIKKIFEYLSIPLNIRMDKVLTSEIDIILIKNIIGLILNIANNNYSQEYKYYMISILRSFLFNYSDNDILKIVNNNSYNDTKLYNICKDISNYIDTLDNYELLEMILDKFNYYENLIKIDNIEDAMIRIDNLLTTAKNLSTMGYVFNDFYNYLKDNIDNNEEIRYSVNNNNLNAVNLMNIHKSKGLEYNICYFCGYYKKFNTRDIKERFIYDNTYGIITPYFKEGIGSTILKDLTINKYLLDDISERIRLFYVSLTRSKEKIIIVCPLDNNKNTTHNIVDLSIRKKYNSFLSIINSISGNLSKYITNINLDDLNITKDYRYNNKINKEENIIIKDKINYHEIIINNEEENNLHASKEINELITKDVSAKLTFGTYMHQTLEMTDFLNINDNNPYKNNILNLINTLNINKDTIIYKEHEFIYNKDNINYRGIIDLILIDNDLIKIVDYKLKNIDDIKYIEQLKVYYNYLSSITNNKNIKLYLYSIIDNKLKEIII